MKSIAFARALRAAYYRYLPALFEGVQVVAISDYGKGFLTKTLLSAIIEHANRVGVPVITDPKGNDFSNIRIHHH